MRKRRVTVFRWRRRRKERRKSRVPAKLLDQPGALDWLGEKLLGDHVRTVFYCWIVLFGLVGTQMGWVLRPFIGSPDKPFTWFRARGSNFFEAVWHNFLNLFS